MLNSTANMGGVNIAAGRKTTVNELIGIMLAEYNKKVTIEFSGSTEGDIHGIWACTKKMKDILGIEEVTKLEDGLNKMLLWVSKVKRN